MKILLTSDLHIKKGIFVDIGIEYLNYISSYCKENEIDKIYFLGDMFEKSSKIYNEAFIPVHKKFSQMSKDLFLTFILGNHDIYSIDRNDSIVESFEPFGKIIKESEVESREGKLEYSLSYTKNEGDILEPEEDITSFLFTHLAIADFTFDNNYHVNEKIAFRRELFSGYKFVFSGHFHKHQVKNNIIFIGSPYQLNINEANTAKGFVVLDTDREEWKFIEYKGAPEFLKISINDIKNLENINFKNKFVRIKIDKKIDEFLKLKYILYEKGALDVVPDFESIIEKIEVPENVNDVDMSMSMQDIIYTYIKNIDNEKIDNKKLIKIFDKISKEV